MTIFDALLESHEKQRTLLDLLVETEGDSEGRADLLERTARELRIHAAAEERFFYVPLMEHDDTQGEARHSVAEHEELDDYLEQLEEEDFSSPGWLVTAKQLRDRTLHHLDEEEEDVFPEARDVLSDDDQKQLGHGYREFAASMADGDQPIP